MTKGYFTKKTVTLYAEQWDGSYGALKGLKSYLDGALDILNVADAGPDALVVNCKTLEGPLRVSPGDWIIRGIKGEYYPCKPDVFADLYDEADNPNQHNDDLTFSQALDAVKRGGKAARRGWNGKGMFIFLVSGSTFKVNRPPLLGIYPEGTEINYHGHVDMRTADGQIVPWLCSQTDMLANDWHVVS